MGYLIPKSARNVKLQLFKGLGLPEAGILAATVVLALLVFNTGWGIGVQIVVIALMALFALMLISPSFITNKKGYQSFELVACENSI